MNLSLKQIWGGTAAVAVLLVAVWYLALFSPQKHQLAKAHESYTEAAQQVSHLDQQVSALTVLEKQIQADSARLEVLDAGLPHNEDLQDVLVQLDTAATSSGVQLTSVAPGTAGPNGSSSSSSSSSGSSSTGGTQQVSLGLAISGSYAEVMTFLTNLTHMNRVVVVDSLTFSPGSNGSLSSTVNTRIFYAS